VLAGLPLWVNALVFAVDLIYAGGPVLNEVGALSQVAAMLGITVTGVFVVGGIERRDPVVRGIGLDSLIVAAAYLGGLGLLFHLR
jgi:cation:H+ antiporter